LPASDGTTTADESLMPSLPEALQIVAPRTANQVMSILQDLQQTMPVGAEFSQIILNDQELVIDGKASSATRVQANIEKSGRFTDSKFVTAISSSNVDRLERFRLTATIAETPEEKHGAIVNPAANTRRPPDDK
ncbi:MAG: PilN domain-containing protein, partial [Gammaproteobacteria bacterium]|nr:PilN domain-containing protein [Gammaproteobacteria bacterium]